MDWWTEAELIWIVASGTTGQCTKASLSREIRTQTYVKVAFVALSGFSSWSRLC